MYNERENIDKSYSEETSIASQPSTVRDKYSDELNTKYFNFDFLSQRNLGDVSSPNITLILLNSPSMSMNWVSKLWEKSQCVICADGGANLLHSLVLYDKGKLNEANKGKYIPHFIKGDLDSLLPSVREYYESFGTTVIQDEDQDNNDLEKCLILAREMFNHNSKGLNYEMKCSDTKSSLQQEIVIILGGFGGRIDQEIACFHSMKLYLPYFDNILLLDDVNLAVALDKGNVYRLSLAADMFPIGDNVTVGLLPIFGPVREISSKGLKWELSNSRLEFGVLISSSNQLIRKLSSIDLQESALEVTKTMHEHKIIRDKYILDITTSDMVLWSCDISQLK